MLYVDIYFCTQVLSVLRCNVHVKLKSSVIFNCVIFVLVYLSF